MNSCDFNPDGHPQKPGQDWHRAKQMAATQLIATVTALLGGAFWMGVMHDDASNIQAHLQEHIRVSDQRHVEQESRIDRVQHISQADDKEIRRSLRDANAKLDRLTEHLIERD